MGQQVVFFADERDHGDILVHARDAGLVAVPELSDGRVIATAPEAFVVPAGQMFFYLLPESLSVVEVVYRELPGQRGTYKLDPEVSPVIELTPSTREADILRDGRVYLDTRPDMPFYEIIKRKYTSLTRQMNKWPRTDRFGFRVGPHTAEAVRAGHLRLMHHRIELHLA